MTDEHNSIDDNEEDLSDPHRYDSADNWDPYKKQRKAAAKLTRDWMSEPASPFRVLNGEELAKTPTRIKEPGQLFGNFWREGEVAILFGESGTGKSILAVQIAESIARGLNGKSAQAVLYFDFKSTLAQFLERYSVERRPGRRTRYKFFKNFSRVDLGDFLNVADNIKGDLGLFLRGAMHREIEERAVPIVIIDDLSFLTTGGNSAGIRLMKTLKLWSMIYGISILAVTSIKERRNSLKPLSLGDLPSFASMADSVFAIARSSMAPDIRYIKHLTSNSDRSIDTVPVFRLDRLSKPRSLTTQLATSTSENYQLSTINSQLNNGPFPGLTTLGHSDEHEHFRDYQREARVVQARTQKALRNPQSIESAIEMLLSREYWRYIER